MPNKLSRRQFVKGAFYGTAALSAAGVASCKSKATSRPNVILIVTDDQGYGDFGIKGNPIIRTPNIDALARDGAEMTNYYVSPVCAPTRACLMTGRYNYRTRVVDTYVGRAMMDSEEVTVAEILNKAGYATGIFGKWHLGDNFPMRPQDQGFEEVLVLRGGGIGQPSDPPGGEGKYTNPILFHNGKAEEQKGYCTDIYFRSAIKWIKTQIQAKRHFFAYIPTNAPHGPFGDVPQKLYEEYKKMNLESDQFPQTVGHKLPKETDTDKLARIFAMITNIDDNVGNLRQELKRLGLSENTLILFIVDNGPNTRRYVAGMKGSKSSVYEGGVRSPLFANLPGVLKAGHKNDRVVAHIDMLPTILEACGVEKPTGLKLDGRSFWSLLTGARKEWPDRTIVLQAHRGNEPVLYHNFMIRNQEWKLVHPSGFGKESFEGKAKFELYDMVNDPLEMKNLVKDRKDKVEELLKIYEKWFEDVSSTRPDNYAPPRIFIGTEYENPVVLTRQDWRHTKGRPWAPDSNGFWKLYAAKPGEYKIRARFKPAEAAGTISLKYGNKSLTKNFKSGQTETLFQPVFIEKGNLGIQFFMNLAGKTKGPWQVDVYSTWIGS